MIMTIFDYPFPFFFNLIFYLSVIVCLDTIIRYWVFHNITNIMALKEVSGGI